MKLHTLKTAALTGVAFATLIAAMPAQAQEGPASAGASAEEEVVVTGSRARGRTELNTPVPVDVISAADIARSGALGGEFGQALQNLVPSFNFPRQSNSGSADIVRPAQLRGLSPDQVLVLVNGKRRHTTSITTVESKTGRGTAPVDFNAIPSNAIKRIEVLRDGAGAQYGSDAIAGVINVILDDAPEGVEVNASYGIHDTHFDPTGEDLSDGETWVLQGKIGIPIGVEGGFLRVGGEYRDRARTYRGGLDQIPIFEDPANAPLVGNRVNFAPGDGGSEDRSLWFNAATPVGNGVEVYAFGTYANREAEGSGFFRYPIGYQNVLSVYPLGYRPVPTGKTEDIALTTGVRGEAGAWTWDTSVNYGHNRYEAGVYNSLNPSLGPTSPRSFFTGAYEVDLFTANADVTRSFDFGLAEPATLAFGIEYRNEGFKSEAGEPASYAAGPFTGLAIGAQAGGGLRPAETRDISRDVFSAYAELSLQLASNLLLDVAGRYENFSDFDDTFAGKAALRWEFAEGLALRASVSNSYRAPSLVQVGYGTSSLSFGPGGSLQSVQTLQVDDPLARALGAPDLDAESAVNYSVGFTAALGAFRFSIDGYRIDVDDRITLSERVDAATLSPAQQALFAARGITAANFFTNAVDTETKGVDIVATYKFDDVLDGTLGFSGAYSYAETEIAAIRNFGNVVVIGVEEANTVEDAAPKSKFILSADWTNETWSVLGRLSRYGEAKRVFNFGGGYEPEQTYGAVFQFDAEIGYQATENVNIYIGASNLFDAYPDRSNSEIFYFGNFPYDVLSPIGMNGRYLYAGVRTSW
ncbi:Vitamin B12 transporter BtuB [Alphaproteobacteria bacterium SO-S41]|nr:Vitamin B12 transporter BtuB [Alphaproteobacteria bacterium SO-S41]